MEKNSFCWKSLHVLPTVLYNTYLSYGKSLLQDVTKWIKLAGEYLSVTFTFLHSFVKCCLFCSERCMFMCEERWLVMIVVNPISVHLSLHFDVHETHKLSYKLQAPKHDELQGVLTFRAWVTLLMHTDWPSWPIVKEFDLQELGYWYGWAKTCWIYSKILGLAKLICFNGRQNLPRGNVRWKRGWCVDILWRWWEAHHINVAFNIVIFVVFY